MLDDPGDIDRNGIPDAIQRDPVVAPEPVIFGEPTQPGLPGITEPLEATADAPAEPTPEMPVAPTPPPDDADEAAVRQYQMALMEYHQRLKLYTELLTNISKAHHEMLKGIADNLRG